jgi:DNA-binding NarL/FixJ family response regulator
METATASHATPGATFLVVEDDEATARTIARLLRPLGKVVVAHRLADALDAVASPRSFTALFIDWHLPDGQGTEVILACRERGAFVPALVLTGDVCDRIADLAHDLDAEVISKENVTRVVRFAKRVIDGSVKPSAAIAAVGRDWTARYDLTRKEARLLRARLSGTSRADLPEVLGVDESTIATHAKHIIHKTGHASLDEAIEAALREVIEKSYKSYKSHP